MLKLDACTVILRRNKFVYFRFRKVRFYGGNNIGPDGVVWHIADQENNSKSNTIFALFLHVKILCLLGYRISAFQKMTGHHNVRELNHTQRKYTGH